MFNKPLVAAALVAATFAALAVKADARPTSQQAPSHDTYYMDRASQNHDYGGN